MQLPNWNEKVKEALDRTEFMALGTQGSDGVWVNPVAFAYTEKLELYFISMLESKHTQNIQRQPIVSCAIFKTERFTNGDVLGLQLLGKATHITDPTDIRMAAQCYFARGGSNDEFLSKTALGGGLTATWQFFKVTPTEVWCFDSREFGEKRVTVPLDDLHIEAGRSEQ